MMHGAADNAANNATLCRHWPKALSIMTPIITLMEDEEEEETEKEEDEEAEVEME